MRSTACDPQEIQAFYENQAHQIALQEYEPSIHNHLNSLELSHCSTGSSCNENVAGLRMCCLNSMFDVCNRLSWQSSTFSLAVYLFDSYSAKNKVKKSDFRLVAFCCLWISSKYNENKPKGKLADALLKRAGYKTKDKKRFMKFERSILNFMNWDLSYPTTESFLDMFLDDAKPNNVERRYGALFLCELAHFNQDIFSQYSPSSIAASAILITNVALLNLRYTHICSHRFGCLDTLLLKSVMNMPSAVRYKYVDCGIQQQNTENSKKRSISLHYSSKGAIICNLIDLAASLINEQLQMGCNKRYYKGSKLASFNESEVRLPSFVPVSPIASPTRINVGCLPNYSSPSTNACGGSHGRSESSSSIFASTNSMIPTPRTTPTTFHMRKQSIKEYPSLSAVAAASAKGPQQQYHPLPTLSQVYTPVRLVPQPPQPYYSQYPECRGVSMCPTDYGRVVKRRRL